MAKFTLHGQEELIDELTDELPHDGTPWDRLLLQAVRQYQGEDELTPELSRMVSRAHDLNEMLPDDREEQLRYLEESVNIRKKIESGEMELVYSGDS